MFIMNNFSVFLNYRARTHICIYINKPSNSAIYHNKNLQIKPNENNSYTTCIIHLSSKVDGAPLIVCYFY